MKKLLNKIRRKAPERPTRITNDTLDEHRKRILAGGRRFKYPVQYARHKLVFNAVIISVVVVLALVGFIGQQLYAAQNTSDFMYRVTKVLPLPVASVDGRHVLFSDYLMKYRSSIHYLEEKEQVDIGSEDGMRQSDFIKQQSMQDAIADTYAAKIADDRDITVSDAELEAFLRQQRIASDGEVSQTTYDSVILDYYGWSPDEYRHAMKQKLLRQKVAFAVDDKASQTVNTIGSVVSTNADIASVATNIGTTTPTQATFGSMGWVPKTNQDGGLATAAARLQNGQVSSVIRSTTGDGYYYVRLNESNDTQVNFDYIHIPLSTFAEQVATVQSDEYIDVPEVTAPSNQTAQ